MKHFVLLAVLFLAPVYAAAAPQAAARVNGVAITMADAQRLAERIARKDMPVEKVWDDALEQLVIWELLAQKAKTDKLTVTPAEIDAEVKRFKEDMQTPERFREALAEAKMSEAEFRADIQRGLLVQKVLDKHVKVEVSAAEIDAFYQENEEEFERPEMVRASHILLKPGSDKEVGRKRAEAALQRAKKGEDFAKLAKELSDDAQTKDSGGDLGYFPLRPTPIAQAAFQMQPGEISGIIETPYGLHIMKVVEKRPAGVVPLADVREEIKETLEDDKREDLEDAYIDELKKGAKIEILERKDKAKKDPASGGGAG